MPIITRRLAKANTIINELCPLPCLLSVTLLDCLLPSNTNIALCNSFGSSRSLLPQATKTEWALGSSEAIAAQLQQQRKPRFGGKTTPTINSTTNDHDIYSNLSQSWPPNLPSSRSALSRSNLTSSSTPRRRASLPRPAREERDGTRTLDWASAHQRPPLRVPTSVRYGDESLRKL